jgi:hypothetical protein
MPHSSSVAQLLVKFRTLAGEKPPAEQVSLTLWRGKQALTKVPWCGHGADWTQATDPVLLRVAIPQSVNATDCTEWEMEIAKTGNTVWQLSLEVWPVWKDGRLGTSRRIAEKLVLNGRVRSKRFRLPSCR